MLHFVSALCQIANMVFLQMKQVPSLSMTTHQGKNRKKYDELELVEHAGTRIQKKGKTEYKRMLRKLEKNELRSLSQVHNASISHNVGEREARLLVHGENVEERECMRRAEELKENKG